LQTKGYDKMKTTTEKTGASFNRATSKQDYATPDDFIAAVVARFGPLAFDLAAHAGNHVTPKYFTKAQDSFAQDWHKIGGLLWLNPEFSNIAPWAQKCADESSRGAKILFLVPASVGSNWFANYVLPRSWVQFLNGRLMFKGATDPYPKDCLLAAYGFGSPGKCETWKWKLSSGVVA